MSAMTRAAPTDQRPKLGKEKVTYMVRGEGEIGGTDLSGVSGRGEVPLIPLALSFSVKSTNTRSTFSSETNMSTHCP